MPFLYINPIMTSRRFPLDKTKLNGGAHTTLLDFPGELSSFFFDSTSYLVTDKGN